MGLRRRKVGMDFNFGTAYSLLRSSPMNSEPSSCSEEHLDCKNMRRRKTGNNCGLLPKCNKIFTSSIGACSLLIILFTLSSLPCPSSGTMYPSLPPPPLMGPPPRRDAPLRLSPHKMQLNNPARLSRGAQSGPHPTLPVPTHYNKNAHHHRGKLLESGSDLQSAAQTLYDLRGFNIPLGGQEETQRFLRQNDPFTFTRPNNNNNNGFQTNPDRIVDTRTTPLVFPSFYQQQQQDQNSKRPQGILNIFGHTQHLSQTKYEPVGGGGGGAVGSGSGTGNQQHLQSQPQTFRPSQIDIGFNQNIPSFKPQQHFDPEPNQIQGRQVDQPLENQQQQILNYRAPQLGGGQKNDNSDEDKFIYVYDDEDYDEGEDEFVDKPQQQINSNRVTTPNPSLRPTASPLVRFPNNPSTSQQSPTAKPLIQSTSTPIPISNQNNDFFSNNNNYYNQPQHQQQQSVRENPFQFQFPQSPRFAPTITPNVEIVPSSERKPPPDQSNAIQPALKLSRVINDDRFRRPQTTNNYQQPQLQQQYFQLGNQQNQNQQRPFNQIVEEEEEEEQTYEHDPEIIQKLNGPFSNYPEPRPETKLRPVNTLVPKNRVPQEDIVLPPNFYNDNSNRFPSNNQNNEVKQQNQNHNRGDITRQIYRPQVQQVQNEVTTAPQPAPPPPQHRLRLTTSPPTSATTPSQSPSRFPPFKASTTPTTTTTFRTTTEDNNYEPPKRTRTRPNRPTRVQTSTNPTTTTRRTTTTLKTTPAPRTTTTEAYYSDEYYDDEDYSNAVSPQINYLEVDDKPRKSFSTTNKSPIRPDFNNNNRNQIHIQEVYSPKENEAPPRRIRPQSSQSTSTQPPRYYAQSPSPTPRGQQRFREQTTLEIPPSSHLTKKTTTGKPLYYAGKMLSKEGGLYAGQTIPLYHVYGSPVPNVAITTVFDRMPSILDGHVVRTTPQPQVVSQKHVIPQQQRGRGRERGQDFETTGFSRSTQAPVVTRTSASPNTRHPSRIRPTVHASPPPTEREPPKEREVIPTRTRPAAPKFVRPQQTISSTTEQDISQPPRRKKIKPGQKRQQIKQEQSVTVSHSVREEEGENEDEQDRPIPSKKNLRPNLHRPRIQKQQPIVQVLQSQSVTSSTESSSTEPPSTTPKLRTRRPRPTQKVQVLQSQNEDDDEEQAPSPPPRPKRVRPRPQKPKFNPLPEYSELSKSIASTQSSAKIGRKPTEAPNRFSSRFREESPAIVTSTHSSVSESDDEDNNNNNNESGFKHFSPPPKSKPRPSFKPPIKPFKPTAAPEEETPPQFQNKPKRIKPQQHKKPAQEQENDPEDVLPPSIRLSAKDVVLNRKPARRIPPGSASDRLKALQERRKKLASGATPQSFRNQQQQEEVAEDEEENKSHRTLRRRKLLNNSPNPNIESSPKPQPQQRRVIKKLRQRPRPQPVQEEEEEEIEPEGEKHHDEDGNRDYQQNKREITHKSAAAQRQRNNVNFQEEDENQDEELLYDTLEKERQEQVQNRKLNNRANGRIPSEVTSDEARSVLGIVQPQNNKSPKQQEETPSYYEDDYEGHPSHLSEQKVSTSTQNPSSSTSEHPKVTVSTSTSSSIDDEEEPEEFSPSPKSSSTTETTTAAYLKSRLRPNKNLLSSLKPKLSSTQQRDRNESNRNNNLSKLLKFRTSSSTYSPINSKIQTMATEDPSLPLEAMFSNVNKSS